MFLTLERSVRKFPVRNNSTCSRSFNRHVVVNSPVDLLKTAITRLSKS